MKILSIVLPCYNESKNLNNLLNSLEKLKKNTDLEIIVVENGSTDDSLVKIKNHTIYKSNSIKLVEIKKNLGYGHGIMSGISMAKGDYLGWCHADLQNNLDDVYNLFKENFNELEKTKSILKGKRLNRNLIDRIFTSGMSILSSIIFGHSLNDINAQPKIFPKKFLSLLDETPIDFSLDLYTLLIAKINNYKIIEHPVVVYKRVAGEAKGGGSFFLKIKLTLRTLNYIFNLKKNKKF